MFSRTTCMITNVKKIIRPDFFSQQISIPIYFPGEMSPGEFVQGQFKPLHHAPLLCIILHDVCTSTYTNRRFLVLFSARKKSCHRHVIPLISLIFNRAKSLKKIFFHTISNLGEATLNLRH